MKYSKITIIFKPPFKPPYFIGSQIRGALGYALKRVVCINPSYRCEDCFAVDNCLYYQFYEERNSFHKYRLDFELGMDYYDFSLILFDDSASQLPYVITSLYRMLSENGLGKDRVKINDFDMFVNDETAILNGNIKLPKNYIKEFEVDDYKSDLTLKLVTPLRIKKDNKFVRENIDIFSDILKSIYQRENSIIGNGFQKFPYEIEAEVVKHQLVYKELARRSNRQNRSMNLGGLLGEIEIKNIDKESYRLLKLGELIGVGKQTVFGLGKIEVKGIE